MLPMIDRDNPQDPRARGPLGRAGGSTASRVAHPALGFADLRLGRGPRVAPIEKRYGIYLFSEKGRPRYVGRVGLTDRSKRAGKAYSSFRTRLRGHVRPRHNQGTYAYARTLKHFHDKKLPLAGTRKTNCEDPEFMAEFQRQCE